MNCKKLHKHLIFYLEGELPAREMKQVKLHLAECSDCANFAAEMQKMLGVIETDRERKINPYFYTRIKARLNSQPARREASFNPVFIRIMQPAILSVLLIAGIYTGIKIGQPVRTQNENSFATTEIVPYLNEMQSEAIESFLME